MSEQGERLARGLHAAQNAHDAQAAAGLYAENARQVEIATGQKRAGRAAIGEGLTSLLAAFPDACWEERMLVASGDRAAIGYVLTGTLQAKFGPFEPAGQSLRLLGVHLLLVEDGEIALCEDYWDAASFASQMRAA